MPGRVWERAFEKAVDQYGFITFGDLREQGEDPVRLRQWHQHDRIERVGHGIYRFRQVPETSLDQYMLATLWPSGRGVLSHETALELHELCDVNPEVIHLTLPRGYRPRRRGGERYVLHVEQLGTSDVTWHESISIVQPAVAIRQAIDDGTPTPLVRQAIDTAQRLGRASREELVELAQQLGARR
ncbi:MAG: type IV toxin-antitoxin system AbiEi family antitoxin domain-containing protein [bacterium]